MAGFLRNLGPTQRITGTIVKSLHTVNCVLFILNALLWALLAKQPGIAIVWLAVGLGELYVIKNTDFFSY
jgi:hypothetical protein